MYVFIYIYVVPLELWNMPFLQQLPGRCNANVVLTLQAPLAHRFGLGGVEFKDFQGETRVKLIRCRVQWQNIQLIADEQR